MINVSLHIQHSGVSSSIERSELGEINPSKVITFANNIGATRNSHLAPKKTNKGTSLTDSNVIVNEAKKPKMVKKLDNNSLAMGKTLHKSVKGDIHLADKQTTKRTQNSFEVSRLQNKQELFEKGVKRYQTCDVKIQELLKLIQKDDSLWKEIHDKMEVRVIKVKEEGHEIVLHPEDEFEERWSGKYHVYLTVQHEDKRLLIDPYIGGKNSCAHVDERDFIGSNWKGEEGKEYVLETIAPIDESYHNDDYIPKFSLKDYMYDLFDPDTYESHKFYYE